MDTKKWQRGFVVLLTCVILAAMAGCTTSASDIGGLGRNPDSTTQGSGKPGETQTPTHTSQPGETRIPTATSTPQPTVTTPSQPTATTPPQPTGLATEAYKGDFFTLSIPKGWRVEHGGDRAGFWFRVQDPANADTQFFSYGRLEPFLKSEAAKTIWGQMPQAEMYSLAPVMTDLTARGLLSVWGECIEYQRRFATSTFTPLVDIQVNYSEEFDGIYAPQGGLESVAKASCTGPAGSACTVMLSTAVFTNGTYIVNGVDTTAMTCYGTIGILAPAGVFETQFDTLLTCVNSIQFDKNYVNPSTQPTNG